MNKINKKLLKKVLSIQSHHSDESEMISYIKKFLGSNKLEYEEDGFGNIYVTKGESDLYPCVVSHMDTVIKIVPNFKVLELNNVLFGFDVDKSEQWGIGGDDKVGIFICLSLLKELDKIKVVFYRKEEIGRVGSSYSIKNNKDFYNNCSYILQCDRYGNSDFITKIGIIDICSDLFVSDLKEVLNKYKYSEASGISTDVLELTKEGVGVSCANISCGYYNHHSNSEYVNIDDIEICYSLVIDIILKLKNTKYSHVYEKPKRDKNYDFYGKHYKKADSDKTNSVLDLFNVVTDKNSEYSMFSEINSKSKIKSYSLSSREPIPILKSNCPKCAEEGSLYIIPNDISIACINCGNKLNTIDRHKIISKLHVNSDGQKFVYSGVEKAWLKKEEAKFSTYFDDFVKM